MENSNTYQSTSQNNSSKPYEDVSVVNLHDSRYDPDILKDNRIDPLQSKCSDLGRTNS